VTYRWPVLQETHRRLDLTLRRPRFGRGRLPRAAGDLQGALGDLRRWMSRVA
jgi:hypothetical protein